ncbi:hypothetical protein OQA88_13360 [Cercophora sp. LCS_1]
MHSIYREGPRRYGNGAVSPPDSRAGSPTPRPGLPHHVSISDSVHIGDLSLEEVKKLPHPKDHRGYDLKNPGLPEWLCTGDIMHLKLTTVSLDLELSLASRAFSKGSFWTAFEYYRRARRLVDERANQPGYLTAYLGIARCYIRMCEEQGRPGAQVPKAREHLQGATDLVKRMRGRDWRVGAAMAREFLGSLEGMEGDLERLCRTRIARENDVEELQGDIAFIKSKLR